MKTKNTYAHLTAKERDKLSFPMKLLKERRLLIGEILDFGCGFGTDADLLSAEGVEISKYDKYYFKDYPISKFDTITCIYVLNVVDAWEQTDILMSVSNLLKPGGKAYFVVRRDIVKEGFRTHFVHKKQTYQTNVVLPFKSIYRNDFTEIYEYSHFENRKDILFETALAYSYLDGNVARIKSKNKNQDFFDLTLFEQISYLLIANRIKKEMTCEIERFF